MKNVFRGVVYNFVCIIVFTMIYLIINKDLTLDSSMSKYVPPSVIDTIYLTTAIQSGVGFSFVYPLNSTAKICMMIQQYFMIASNLVLLYLFTLKK